MKTKEIAKQYGIDQVGFEQYLREVGAGKDGAFSFTLDEDIPGHVNRYKARLVEVANEEKRKQDAENEKQRALANMLITSGFTFDGYKIKKYSGYISGDDCQTQTPSYAGENGINSSVEAGESLR